MAAGPLRGMGGVAGVAAGRWGAVAVAVLLSAAVAAPPARGQAPEPAGTPPPTPPRILVLGLDAVPFSVVDRMAAAGPEGEALFAGYSGPVPLVSTFPSTTNVALSGIFAPFGVERSPGYEVRFFDRRLNRIRGGGPMSYHRLAFPWRRFVDWTAESLTARMFGELRPVRSSVAELETAAASFLASERRVYFAYVTATDAAGHLKSPSAYEKVLRALDRILTDTHRRSPTPFATVVFSDHGISGGSPLTNVRSGVRQALRQAGYHLDGRLGGPRQVVVAELGMVSSFILYTAAGQEGEVAALAAAVPGVDLCVAPTPLGFRVVAGGGARAWLGRRRIEGEARWAYKAVEGDPLGYLPVVAELRRRSGEKDGLWFPDRWWFEATADARYPDALYRLARAFDLVDNEASVVCSAAPDSMYGALRTAVAARLSVGRLRWTHGALHREATLGFFLTDVPGWELAGPQRFDAALAPLVARVRAERAAAPP